MATLEQLQRGLISADQAGDADAARVFAAEIAKMKAPSAPEQGGVKQVIGDVAAGALRGAGSIGATILAPIDAAAKALGVSNSFVGRDDRRAAMDTALSGLGADTNSIPFAGGKLAAEIAGTSGIGGLLAKPLAKLASPIASGLATALQTGGMRVGDLAGTAAAIPVRLGAGSLTGAASAGMVNPEDAMIGGGIGAAIPGAAVLSGQVRKLIGGITKGGVSPEVNALAQRAQELGINIPADRLVNSKPLNALASALNYVPFSGRAATEELMTSQTNRALSRTFGQDSSNITQALRSAETKLGGKFDDFLKNNTVTVDKQFLSDLADSANKAAKELGSDQAGIINRQVDEIIAKGANGQLDGQAAYNIKKTLDGIGRRNSPEAFYAIDLKQKLMDALNRSVSPDAAQSFAQTRQQYGNMLNLEKLAKNGAEGEISIARLANMRNINNQPLQEIADIAAQFVKPREAQHGAMQRAVAASIGFGAGGLPGLLGGAAVGRGLNSALNSNALRGGLLGQQMIESPESLGLLGSGLYRTLPVLSAQ